LRVSERNRPVGIEFIRIKQPSRSAVQCVTTIKRREFFVLVTLTKEVSSSGFDDVS
jgi:hypothetical protein